LLKRYSCERFDLLCCRDLKSGPKVLRGNQID
jgi:hypothetical protein